MYSGPQRKAACSVCIIGWAVRASCYLVISMYRRPCLTSCLFSVFLVVKKNCQSKMSRWVDWMVGASRNWKLRHFLRHLQRTCKTRNPHCVTKSCIIRQMVLQSSAMLVLLWFLFRVCLFWSNVSKSCALNGSYHHSTGCRRHLINRCTWLDINTETVVCLYAVTLTDVTDKIKRQKFNLL